MAKYSHWYTLTEARTSVRTTAAAALWLWSEVKMSAPLPVFIVHFNVFAWDELYLFIFTFAWLAVPGMSCSFYRPHLTWQGYTGGYTLVHSLSRKYALKTHKVGRRQRNLESPRKAAVLASFRKEHAFSKRQVQNVYRTCCQFQSA